MIKHLALLAVLAGLLTGCQTTQNPVVEIDRESVVEDPVADNAAATASAAAKTLDEQVSRVDQEATAAEPKESTQIKAEPNARKRTTNMILMKTSKGDIKIELNGEKAPKTVSNFLGYVASGHYAGTIFHRVIDGFMIQGGGFDENMNQKPAPDMVENEAANGLHNDAGTIAMARTAAPHSASAQFFINVNDNTFLNYPGQDGWGYCVFGKVVAGMDVVNEIKGVSTGNAGPLQNVPKEPIIINEVVVLEE